jgi:hypothetical protein
MQIYKLFMTLKKKFLNCFPLKTNARLTTNHLKVFIRRSGICQIVIGFNIN